MIFGAKGHPTRVCLLFEIIYYSISVLFSFRLTQRPSMKKKD